MSLLSNREIATLIWLVTLGLALAIWVVRDARIRSGVKGVIRAFFVWRVQVVLVAYLLYTIGVVLLARWLDVWEYGLLKDTLIIVLTVGVPLVFHAVDVKSGASLARRVFVEVLGIAALLVFYLNLESLPLWAELVIQPLLATVLLMATAANLRAASRRLVAPLQVVAGLITLFLFVNTTVRLVRGWRELDHLSMLKTFALSIWLPVALVPLVYCAAVIMRTETVLVLLPLHNNKVRPPLRVRLALLLGLRFSARYASVFNGRWLGEVARSKKYREARQAMRLFRADVRAQERAEQARRKRLDDYAGVPGAGEDGLTLDRREFAATKETLTNLWTMQLGWYRNRLGHFKDDMLNILGDTTKRGLPADHGIALRVSANRQAWLAYRRTPSGFNFGVGGSTSKGDEQTLRDEWRYTGSEPPTQFPGANREGWTNATRGDSHPEWLEADTR